MNKSARKKTAALYIAGAAVLGFIGISNSLPTVSAAPPAKTATATESKASQSVNSFLNSFYKPALKGQFPEDAVKPLKAPTLGKTTRQEIIKAIGEPEEAGTGANAFDSYHGSMGQPSLAFFSPTNRRSFKKCVTLARESSVNRISAALLKKF